MSRANHFQSVFQTNSPYYHEEEETKELDPTRQDLTSAVAMKKRLLHIRANLR